MSYVVVCTVALLVSALTLFSGFGLGTLLMPAFAIFFPVPVAIAATAVVHLANNLFKMVLVGRRADAAVVVRFALPAAAGAMLGAWLLTRFAEVPPLATYELGGRREVTLVKLTIAALMIVFALFELRPGFERLGFDRRWLPLGGLLSGFFGGVSGHQGALRAAFLVNAGLDQAAFIGTNVAAAVIVDVARLVVYGAGLHESHLLPVAPGTGGLVMAATLAAFVGAFLGTRLIGSVTMHAVRVTVGAMLLIVALGLGAGLV